MPAYYRHSTGGVVSTTIDRYVYVSVKSKFDDLIRLSYSLTETVESVNQIKHDLMRAALELTEINKAIEITTISDLPSNGTGMGASSSFLIGLLNALTHHLNAPMTQKELAEKACYVDLDMLKKPIGKQDQYAASFGGLNWIQFNPDDTVIVEPIKCSQSTIHELQSNMILLYTNTKREADSILKHQSLETSSKQSVRGQIQEMVEMAKLFREQIESNNLSEIGMMLDDAWQIKKSLAKGITSEYLDHCYELGRKHGALGGKLLGAGGGGFLMLYAYPDAHKKIKEALSDLPATHVRLESKGSRIVYAE